MASKNIFLDTNIVADIIDSTRLKHLQSIELLTMLIKKNYTIYISEDMITTLYYILEDKKNVLEFLKGIVYVDWKISEFGIDLLKIATDLSLENKLDLEDILQSLCARENNCEALITNDKNFYDCAVSIYTAEYFLEKN